MKKSWIFGMAFAIGVSQYACQSQAQYGMSSIPTASLAPSGYAINENVAMPPMGYAAQARPGMGMPMANPYGQPYAGSPFNQVPYAQPVGMPMQTNVQMVAYPQEVIPAPGVNAQQAPDRGWVGPNNGQYQPQGSVMQPPVVGQPQMAPQLPNGSMHGGTVHGGVVQSSPMQGAPMQNAPMQAAPVPMIDNQGASCGGGVAYGADPGYANMIAPTAAGGYAVGGYSSYAGGGYGGAACGAPVYYGAPMASGFGPRMGRFSGLGAVPGRAYFAGGNALLFRRVDDHNVALSYDTTMPTDSVLGTRDARQEHLNGFEVFGGRYFNCGRNAVMFSYWQLFPEDETFTTVRPVGGNYRSRYHFNGIQMPGGTVYDMYDGALAHQLVRSSDYQNFEANLLGFSVGGAARTWNYGGGGGCGAGCGSGYGGGGCGGGGCGGYGASCGGGYDACGYGSCSGGGCGGYGDGGCGSFCGGGGGGCGAAVTGPCGYTPNGCGSRLNWTWLAGFRYFRFVDRLQYNASETDANFNGAIDDVYYDNNVRNDLVGAQIGGWGTYCLGRRFNVYASTKGGVYNNHSELYTRVGRNGANPLAATINSANVYNGQSYVLTASQNNAAFLGEFGVGLGACIHRGWTANVGYRVIGVSGVATAVNTIPVEMLHLGNVADYNTTSSLLLHGLTIGGTYNF